MARPDIRGQWNANAAAWTELSRAGFDLYRDLVNTPAFFALLPQVDALACLDLGCGEGYNTRMLAGHGARVAALDVAESFITAAAESDHNGISCAVLDVGLVIEAIAEPCADEETVAAHPQVADTRIAPYFLIVRARKP